MGFRDFNRVKDALGKDVHLTVTDARVDAAHERFVYEVSVRGIPKQTGDEYLVEHWHDDWFPTDYLAVEQTGSGTYRIYVGDGYAFPANECDVIRPPRGK